MARRNPTPTPIPVRRSGRELAENIAAWRRLRSLTSAQVAERAGVNRETFSRLENDAGSVSVENLLRVLRVLGMMEAVVRATDPYETDVGRLRADEQLPQRVRERRP
jgi:transcriptional regulator with XRE-family HTH domain